MRGIIFGNNYNTFIFPEESMLDGNPNCINKEWILNKWTEMITDCVDINNAEILV